MKLERNGSKVWRRLAGGIAVAIAGVAMLTGATTAGAQSNTLTGQRQDTTPPLICSALEFSKPKVLVVKVGPGGGGDPVPIVTTCSAGAGESCVAFAAGCLASGGYYDGDGTGGTCCSGVDHPNSNPNSACN
jgi:hypothetical protein